MKKLLFVIAIALSTLLMQAQSDGADIIIVEFPDFTAENLLDNTQSMLAEKFVFLEDQHSVEDITYAQTRVFLIEVGNTLMRCRLLLKIEPTHSPARIIITGQLEREGTGNIPKLQPMVFKDSGKGFSGKMFDFANDMVEDYSQTAVISYVEKRK